MINIEISGPAGVGKTTLMVLIAQTLRNAGFNVDTTHLYTELSASGILDVQLTLPERLKSLRERHGDKPIVMTERWTRPPRHPD